MNFYYFMHLACPLQEPLSPWAFIERLGLAFALQRADQDNGVDPENPTPADQEHPVRVRLDGAECQIPRREVRDLHNDFLGLARTHCLHCPVSKSSDLYGCVGVLPLPLSPRGEKWLFDQFAPPDPAHSYFAGRIRHTRLPVRRHERLLAGPSELSRALTPDRPALTSTQLFYYLLNLRELRTEPRLRLLTEFGAVKARPREVEELSALLATAGENGWPAADSPELARARKIVDGFKPKMKFEKSDDESVAALKQYFMMGLRSLGAGIRMYASLM